MGIKRLFILLPVVLLLLPVNLVRCRPGENTRVSASHGTLALEYIEYINDNLYERLPFSERELETALWIADELHQMGYARDDIEVQTYHRTDVEQWLFAPWDHLMWGMFETDGLLRMYSQNVILTVPGQSEQTIIAGAHYDGMIWPGGNDNATGMALMLESAYLMLEHDNYYTIEYVFFGAEELGFLGTRYYYDSLTQQQRDNIVLMVNADVLLSGDQQVYGAGWSYAESISENDISRQIYTISRDLYHTYGIEAILIPESLTWGSDHYVFFENGHTAVYLTSVFFLEEPKETDPIIGFFDDHYITLRAWHSTEDCIHYINETWPGLAETNIPFFSIFLETILLTVR